jgi:hypothetical protein
MAKAIYRMYLDFGRSGFLEGTFSAEKEDASSLTGKGIYFGEVLGKHSDVYRTVEDGDITLITDDPEAVEIFERFNLGSGYNPFDYLDGELAKERVRIVCSLGKVEK